jgi:membrane-bound ClpP family serine protease
MGSEVLWPLVCLTLGLSLIVLEVFIPSGGLIGLLSLGLIVVSIWLAFSQSMLLGVKFLAVLAVGLPIALGVAVRVWPHTPIGRWMFLRPPSQDEVESAPAPIAGGTRLEYLIGRHGRSLTPLRPSGVIELDGRRIDALAEEGFVAANLLVQVVQIRAGQAIVRAATESFGLDDVLDGPLDNA